jgi:hypothetical protein
MADKYILKQHIKKLCKPNLRNKRIKYCATCPFEDIIIEEDNTLKELFIKKRSLITMFKLSQRNQGELKFSKK